jgi:hypothetical protein
MTLQAQIDFFFASPLPMQTGSPLSTLHLNRREVQDCLIGDVIAEEAVVADPRERRRLFAAVMVIAAGVDLLGKFYAGSDKSGGKGGVGDRIVEFAEKFVFTGKPSAREFAEVLYYGCRNPMLHSFTLHNDRFRITLTNELRTGAIWRATAPDGSISYVVSVEGLYTAYVAAIHRYEAVLRSDTDLQAKFSAMFPNYGSIGVQSYILSRVIR